MHFIIEGCDRLGKSTLINQIKQELGFHQVIHFGKPEVLNFYSNNLCDGDAKEFYQTDSFINGFVLLSESNSNLIFDRFHIGEFVYAPRYRGYDGSYVFNLEKSYEVDKWDHVTLVLMTTSDWSFIQDDGESFDFSKKEEEQNSFIEAFNKSIFKHKVLIDINDRSSYKNPKDILAEITRG
jgi:thymidylate kinase